MCYVRFKSELEFFNVDYFDTPDINNNKRVGIKFFFKRKGSYIPVHVDRFKSDYIKENEFEYENIMMPNHTERSGLVTPRVGQGAYRKRISYRWEYQCAVTKFDKLEVLIASHIVPWSKATDQERLDVHNGILLSPINDALFDKHLITFDEEGKIILSNNLELKVFEKIGVTGRERINNQSKYNAEYLERHNESFIKV